MDYPVPLVLLKSVRNKNDISDVESPVKVTGIGDYVNECQELNGETYCTARHKNRISPGYIGQPANDKTVKILGTSDNLQMIRRCKGTNDLIHPTVFTLTISIGKAADYTVRLSNGVIMPLVGLGTWQAKDSEELHSALKSAIDSGYRYFDTAAHYDNEEEIGKFFEGVFKEGKLKRSDIFLTTKLPFNSHEPKHAEEMIQKQLKALKTDYIDLYLMHNACSVKRSPDGGFLKNDEGKSVFDDTPHIDTWCVFEKFYKEKKLRALGISNFRCDQIQDLYDKSEIKPHNLQVELHIYHRQRKVIALCKKLDIKVISYATLGSPGRKEGFGPGDYPDADCLGHPLVKELAEKYKRSAGQILLRHAIQQGISVIPKSVKPERVKQNFNIFDFEISEDDMKRFDDEIKEDVRLFSFSFAKGHPKFPPYEV